MKIQKISIIGCGSLGMMYAAHIQKSALCELQFIADQARIDRYKETEFYVNGVRQYFKFVSPDADSRPSDLVIFAVKYNNLRDAVSIAKNHIGKDTIIMSFLNGITSEEIIGETYNPAKILHSMVAGMDATKTGNSVIYSKMGYIAFGSPFDGHDEDINDVSDFFNQVGLKNEAYMAARPASEACERAQKDIIKTMWWKYMLNIGVNQASAVLKAPYGVFQRSEHAEAIIRMAMREVLAVACSMGIALCEQDIEDCIALLKTLSPDGMTSMCQDIEAKRVTEVDMFAGTLMQLGKQYNVPVPVNTFLFNAIKVLETVNQ